MQLRKWSTVSQAVLAKCSQQVEGSDYGYSPLFSICAGTTVSSLGLPQYKKDMDVLEKAHWRAIEMMSGLEHMVYKLRLRARFILS